MSENYLFEYEFTSNGKHHVKVFKNRIEIEHGGLRNRLVKGSSGKLIIYVSKLSAIEVKHTSLTTGYVEFMASGLSHERETTDKVKQDNVIMFNSEQDNRMADTLVEIINDLM